MVKRTAEEAHIDEPVRQTRRAYSQSQQGGVAAAPVHELIDVDAYTRDFAHVSPEQGETASAPAYSYVDGDGNANVYSQAHVSTSPQQGEFLSAPAPAPDFAYDDANAYSAAYVNSSSQQEGFASASASAPAPTYGNVNPQQAGFASAPTYGNVSAQQEEFAPASGYNYTGAEANAPAYVNPNPFDNIHGRPYVSSYAHLYADPNANVNPTVNPYNPYFPQPLAEPASAQQPSPVIAPEPTYDGSSAQVPVEQTALDTEAGGSGRRRGSATARGKGKARAGASARVNRESQASKNSQQFRATHLRGAARAAAAAAIPATPVAPAPHTPRTPAPQYFGAEGEGGPSNWAETAGRPIGLEDYILEEDEDPFLGGTNANDSVVAGPSNWAQTAGGQIGLEDYTLDGDEVPFIEDDIVEDDNDSVGSVDENAEDNVDDNVDDNIDDHIDDDDVDPDAIILEEESEEEEEEAAKQRKKKKGKGKAKAAGKKRKTRRRKFEDEVDHSKIIRDRQQPSIDAHLAWEAKCQAFAEKGKEVPQKLAKEKPKSRTGTSCDRCVILRLSCDPDPFCCKNCQEVRGGAATCRETRKNTNITERRGEVELVTEAMLDEIHERNQIIFKLREFRNSLLTDNGLLEMCIKRLCAQLRRAGLEPDLGNFIQAYFHNQPAPNVNGVPSMPGNVPVSDPGMAAGPMQGHYTAHNQPAVPPVPQGPPPHAQGQNGPRLMPPAEIAGPSHVNDQTMPQQMGRMRRPAANDQLAGWQGMTTGNMPFQNPYQAVSSQAAPPQVDPRQVGSYPGMLTPHAQRAQMFMQPPTAVYPSMQTDVNQFQQGAVPQQTMSPHNPGVGLSGTVDPNWDDNAAQEPTGVTNWTGVGNQPMGPSDRMGLPAMSPTVGTMPNPTPVRNEFDDLFDAERAQAQDPGPIGDADDASLHDEGQFQNDDEGYDPASTSAEYPGTGEYPEGGPADQCQVGGVDLEGLTSITGLPEQPQDPGSFDSVQTQLDEVAADIVQLSPDVASHIFSSDAMPAGRAGGLLHHEESTRDEGATPGHGSNLEELTPVPSDMWEEAEQLRDEPVEDQARFEVRAAVNQPSSGTEGIILGEVEQEAFWGLPNSLEDLNPSLLVANALDLTASAHHEVYMPSFPNDASGLEGQGEEVEGRPSEAAPASGERQEEEETAQQVPNDEAPEGPYDDADDDADSLFAGVDDNGPDELVEAGAFEGPTIAQGVAAEERVAVDSDDDTYATDDSVDSLAAGHVPRKRQRSPPGHLDDDTRDRKRQRR